MVASRPEEPLSTFDSPDFSTDNLSGTWTLEIQDDTKFDTGTLNSWSITALYAPIETPNSPPDAVDDSASTQIDAPVTIDVLANDTDPDVGDTLSVTAVGTAANGSVVDHGDGTVTYTPNAGYTGSDSFTYTISDGNGGEDTATVSISVGDTAAEQTFPSPDTPQDIADPHPRKGPRTTTSDIDITSSDYIASLMVDVDITHGAEASLVVTLESSSLLAIGQQTLEYDPSSDGWTLVDPTAFDGQEMGGTWTLSVTDPTKDGVTGTLNAWSLTVTPQGAAQSATTTLLALSSAASESTSGSQDLPVDALYGLLASDPFAIDLLYGREIDYAPILASHAKPRGRSAMDLALLDILDEPIDEELLPEVGPVLV